MPFRLESNDPYLDVIVRLPKTAGRDDVVRAAAKQIRNIGDFTRKEAASIASSAALTWYDDPSSEQSRVSSVVQQLLFPD